MSYALDGLVLEQAMFTTTDPSKDPPEEEEQPKKPIEIVRLKDLGNNLLYFWTKIKCTTKKCESLLKSGEVKLVHRWVQMYGTRQKTEQLRTFLPKELSEHDNAVRSEQEIKYPGRWFIEVSTSDGETLCLEKQCKFKLGVVR